MTGKSLEVITLDKVQDVLLNGGVLETVDSDQMQADMVRSILESGTLAEAFAAFKTTPARDVDGVLLDVEGIAWVASNIDGSAGVYGLFKCTLIESGQQVTVSMGGRSLMASFVWAQRNRAMPIRGTFREERSKSNPKRSFWTFVLADPDAH